MLFGLLESKHSLVSLSNLNRPSRLQFLASAAIIEDSDVIVFEPSEVNWQNRTIRGKTIACSLGTTSDVAISKFLGKNYKGIKRYKKTTIAFLELRNHKVDAAIGDFGIVMYYIKSNPEAKLRVVKDIRFPKEYYGMAVRKGDTELLLKINRGLKKIKENGTYEEIYQKWFKT